MLRRISLFLLLAITSIPAYSQVYGSLANFDVVNDTGKTAHGFEIEIHDIHKSNITSIFGDATRWPNMERYGVPAVTEFSDATGFGVRIRYQANYNGGWNVGTPSGTLPVNPSDSCWPYGAPTYGPNYPCDHFGVSTNVATPNIKYSWLIEDTVNPANLLSTEATVPNPVFTVTPQPAVWVQPPPPAPAAPLPPPVLQPQPPLVNVAIAAPAPNEFEFGEPRWVKVTATGTLQNVAVEDLVAENAVIKQAKTQVQIEWQLIQVDAGNPGSGKIDITGVALDKEAFGVVYRFEYYKYIGDRDPETNEAKPLTSDTPSQPDPTDLGSFIVAQNAGVNFDGQIPAAPPLPNAPAINATIAGAVINQPYNQVIDVTPGNPGDTLTITVTGLPSGLTFDPVTNAIVGTPLEAGSFPLTIEAADDANGLTTIATTNIDVAYAPVVFDVTFPNAIVGSLFNYTFSATGNGAITYSILESLPGGLTLSGDTLTGTPEGDGSFPLTVTARDVRGFSQNASATLVIEPGPVGPPPPPPAPAACSGTNEVITNFSPRGQWIETLGGIQNGGKAIHFPGQNATTFVPPLKADATAFNPGNLATYSGTMDQANVFCVADTMTLSQGLAFPPIVLQNGQEGVAYTPVAISPTGGIQPYTMVVSNLPSGMTFNGIEIGGMPLVAGPYTIGISINDSNGQSVFYNANLVIDPAPVPPLALTAPQAAATVGIPLSYGPVSATGGVGPYTYTFTSVPAWATTGATGISGTPNVAGPLVFTITATDSKNSSVSTNVTITVDPAPVVISGTLGNGQVGTPYSGGLTATGGNGSLNWSLNGLIPGVNFANGVFSGTPTTAGAYTLSVTAADANGTSASATRTVTIANPVAPPPASCTKPANAKSFAVSKQKITAVTATTITVGGKVVKTGCATVSWNGATGFKVGDYAEVSKGFTVNGINTAQKITIN